jgi:hypothetical protein
MEYERLALAQLRSKLDLARIIFIELPNTMRVPEFLGRRRSSANDASVLGFTKLEQVTENKALEVGFVQIT